VTALIYEKQATRPPNRGKRLPPVRLIAPSVLSEGTHPPLAAPCPFLYGASLQTQPSCSGLPSASLRRRKPFLYSGWQEGFYDTIFDELGEGSTEF